MERQLLLLSSEAPEWQLDEETKDLGRRNGAQAKQVLAAARRAALLQARRDDAPHAA